MGKVDFIKLLKEHCEEKYEEYISSYCDSNDIKFKYMCLGRANSYMEIIGFIIGCSLMEDLYKECITYEEK